jgi:hypothetical protein
VTGGTMARGERGGVGGRDPGEVAGRHRRWQPPSDASRATPAAGSTPWVLQGGAGLLLGGPPSMASMLQ